MAKARVRLTSAKAAELSDKMGIAALTGSKRLVTKATKIRVDAIFRAMNAVARRKSDEFYGAGIDVLRAAISAMSTDAQWWIDHIKDASRLVVYEIECANRARLDEARRAKVA